MLQHLGYADAHNSIVAAIATALREGSNLKPYMGV